MGADGHIRIWRDDKMREAFSDWEALVQLMPTHYADELDGTKYHHIYWGDNLSSYWDEEPWWWASSAQKPTDAERARFKEFVSWIDQNSTHWEVWT